MSPYGRAQTNNEGYGWLGSLMALDIAVIQDKYGVNEDWATGNDTYVLKDVNEWGVYIDSATGQPAEHDATNQATARDGYYEGQSTYYSSIWDADGIDQIIYNGARNTNIDLRAATLQYEYGGAGWMSYAFGIHGGFTIANGVTVENATSGSGNDVLIGNSAVNILIGGRGNDRMEGGANGDFYRVEDAGDTVIEGVGGGFDAAYVGLAVGSYTLNAGSELELLSAIDPSSGAALDLIGNEYGQTIIGTAGVNALIGGRGNDVMAGGAGGDFYRVEDAGDVILENVGGGVDAAYVALALSGYTLNAGAEVEMLSAIAPSSTAAFDLNGNEFGQTIIGTAGVNVLIGGGGNDVLAGGLGNDIYRVEEAGDAIVEFAGEGNDAVYAVGSYTLASGYEIEVLAAITPASTAALNLTGNNFGNTIFGSDGANVIDGKGGNDALAGYGGADVFAFTTALGGSNVDSVFGFVAGSDKIGLDDAVFTAIGATLNANAFVVGSAAADADDRIIYNSTTGQLFYDADGNGGGAAIQFATLQGAPTLTVSDFQMI
jgi:Ca2+-binding RTX toxin-like protein